MERKIADNTERLNGLEASVNSKTIRKVVKQLNIELNEVTKLRKREQNMAVKEEKYEVTKLIVVSLIIPLLNGFGLILSDWLKLGVWSWVPIVIVINTVSIPVIVSWLSKKFDKKELANEKVVSALKEKHAKEILVKNDELNAQKINVGIARAELKNALEKIERLEK